MSNHQPFIRRSFAATLEKHTYKPVKRYPLSLTTETIAFQANDMFGPQLEEVISKYIVLIDAGATQKSLQNNKDLRRSLEKVVKDRLGLSIDLIVDDSLAAVIPNVYVPHNAVLNSDYRDYFDYFYEEGWSNMIDKKVKDSFVMGAVNTSKAKVTGWFSEQVMPLFMNFYELYKTYGLTAPEITAVLLHELGHAFEAIIYCSNINTTNQVLSDLVRYIKDTPEDRDVEYIYKKIKSVNKESTRELAESLASDNKVVMEMATYRLYVGTVNSLMSTTTYDRTTFEALADNFASRFNYGVYLITGLEKFDKDNWDYRNDVESFALMVRSMIYIGLASIGMIMSGILIAIGGVGVGVLIAMVGFGLGFFAKLMFESNYITKKDMTYDNIKDRYLRIRRQMIEIIKTSKLKKNASVAILEQLRMIDSIISSKKVFDNPIAIMAINLFPTERIASNDLRYQQEMERLISNDIFIASERLRLLEV